MGRFRKFICHLLGHRSICLGHWVHTPQDPANPQYGYGHSYTTHWKCERCGYEFTEGWDE